MDKDDLERHLTGGGAAPTTGGSGPAADETPVMQVLSVVSTDMGRLDERLNRLDKKVERGQGEQAKATEALSTLAEQVASLGHMVEQLTGEEEAPTPPPQPWDWAAMGWEEHMQSLATLAEWVVSDLGRWWPRVLAPKTGLPPCWVKHPDMCRDLSLLFVSYQQAYQHPTRRVHHEVDFRRCLDDMLRDIAAAADAYGCYAEKGSNQRHVVNHTVRSDLPVVGEHIRQTVLDQIYQADQQGEAAEVSRLVDLYKITPVQLRDRMAQAFTECLAHLEVEGLAGPMKTTVVREAGRLLRDYEVISTRTDDTSANSLVWAPQLQDVMYLLHQWDPQLFSEVAPKYEPLIRKYATIKENMRALVATSPSAQALGLMQTYKITMEDVEIVRNRS